MSWMMSPPQFPSRYFFYLFGRCFSLKPGLLQPILGLWGGKWLENPPKFDDFRTKFPWRILPYLPIFFHLPYIPSERSSDFRNLVCFRSSSKTFRNSSLCVLAFRNRADTVCSQGSWWWMVSTWGFYGDVMGIYPNISKNHADVMQIR